MIEQALISNEFLCQMEQTQIESMIDAMQTVEFAQNDWIIRQGEHGNQLFVIEGWRERNRTRSTNTNDCRRESPGHKRLPLLARNGRSCGGWRAGRFVQLRADGECKGRVQTVRSFGQSPFLQP